MGGKIVETPVVVTVEAENSKNSMDALKNLTTFKLTLEDNEKETKDKLHLPYFE